MEAALRAKMCVHSVKYVADKDGNIVQEEVGMGVVYGDGANKEWAKWTPAGQLSLTISNPEAFHKVKPGQFFFVDLIETDKDAL
jgi:hypothetical protein